MTTFQTVSIIDDSEQRFATRRLSNDDWVLPMIEPGHGNTERTTAIPNDATSNGNHSSAAQRTRPTVSAPVNKNMLKTKLSQRGLKLLQQWECIVLRVTRDCVECEMHDLTSNTTPVEIAEVYIDEFNHFDRPLLEEGTVFYWSIGHETSRSGQVRKYSMLRVRRMPRLSALRRKELSTKAKEFSELFTIGDE